MGEKTVVQSFAEEEQTKIRMSEHILRRGLFEFQLPEMCITSCGTELQGSLLVSLFQKMTCYTHQNKTLFQNDHGVKRL